MIPSSLHLRLARPLRLVGDGNVGAGTLDVGITGKDLLEDAAAPAESILDLGFARSTFYFAARPDGPKSVADLAGKSVATSLSGAGAQAPCAGQGGGQRRGIAEGGGERRRTPANGRARARPSRSPRNLPVRARSRRVARAACGAALHRGPIIRLLSRKIVEVSKAAELLGCEGVVGVAAVGMCWRR
ncbi:hypothetical protein B0T44_08100 [Nocardia donostiensis]|uniref:ATP phosphoribosyltransferase catalytic domain-containing protein n=1 Tax=Nocardia donostiensis TaxID=1538463 RepID=A0A1W0BGD0_9NOCA|nr:hypothetical protein B0T46_15495 [Nocardia donostiensis]OQS13073.1 hypothetical protein B0T36_21120 [Nocardia donostiensis]OQS21557.1 hypothetical protein B0T44_08100 [Nocardia donostiensis]